MECFRGDARVCGDEVGLRVRWCEVAGGAVVSSRQIAETGVKMGVGLYIKEITNLAGVSPI